MIFIVSIIVYNIKITDTDMDIAIFNESFKFFDYLSKLFVVSWTILGTIIFWNLMDNSLCSDAVYNYLSISLIIKLVCLFFRWLFCFQQ